MHCLKLNGAVCLILGNMFGHASVRNNHVNCNRYYVKISSVTSVMIPDVTSVSETEIKDMLAVDFHMAQLKYISYRPRNFNIEFVAKVLISSIRATVRVTSIHYQLHAYDVRQLAELTQVRFMDTHDVQARLMFIAFCNGDAKQA